ncbi:MULTISPECIES: hypothetical protein [Micromonospora]|uniref:PE domain-containing protein n=1 Tax=Micromonospora sicca TaxID=2202420 RepID=A0A317DH31_9ACTN|nr:MULTISPECIES: hypothetical protein [unclassified Micromonospora]MBM0224288.1 hypothetical protein [Micromonospora sp. ATA51]PWR13877.1 hypothetical protein DKT69_18695 [Micromonospora sp. 4G51]
MQIDPDGLAAAGNAMRSAADDFASRVTAFQARLASIGPAFGDDDTGSLLGVAHEEASGFVFEVLTEALEEVGLAGDDLAAMARSHEENEADTGDLFHSILGRLGG